jgi:hypothetical protein
LGGAAMMIAVAWFNGVGSVKAQYQFTPAIYLSRWDVDSRTVPVDRESSVGRAAIRQYYFASPSAVTRHSES